MKKTYITPSAEVIKLRAQAILDTSTYTPGSMSSDPIDSTPGEYNENTVPEGSIFEVD